MISAHPIPEQVYLLTVKRNGRVFHQAVFTTLKTADAAAADYRASSDTLHRYTTDIKAKSLLS